MKVRKIFWLFLFLMVADMLVIFLFSSQGAKSSTEISKGMATNIIEHTVGVNENKTKAAFQLYYAEKYLRKAAHVLLYMILGITSYLTVKASDCVKKNWIVAVVSLACCVLYASCDEYYQTFMDGRNGTYIDVLIDGGGAILGILSVWLASKKFSFGIK